MTDANIAIADLRSGWHALHDLDRGQAIKSVHQSGVSLRKLAPLLNCSKSLLTHLLQAIQAPIQDRIFARQGLLSTRALVRGARGAGIRRTALHREEIAFELERSALQNSAAIRRWFDEEGIESADRGLVIGRSRLLLSLLGRSGRPPHDSTVAALPPAEMARSIWNAHAGPGEDRFVTRMAYRFAFWAFHGISDALVRRRAIELAIVGLGCQ